MEYLLPTLRKKQEVDSLIRDTLEKVLVLRFGLSSDAVCLQLDDVLYKSARDVSKFATVALVEAAAEEIQVYLKYFDITYVPSIVFFFNAHHMKLDSGYSEFLASQFSLRLNLISSIAPSGQYKWDDLKRKTRQFEDGLKLGSADHTKWVGTFQKKQDFVDVVEAIYRGAMKGKLIVSCPLPPERIPKFQLLYKDV